MDHCYSHTRENFPVEDFSRAVVRDTDLPGATIPAEKGADHSYSNNRENLQHKDHSYFQFAKKTPLVHHFRVTTYNDKRNRSTPLVSKDHTYVRALQLRQNKELDPRKLPRTENCQTGACSVCERCMFNPITDHSYRKTYKPNNFTPWSDHSYMTFV